MFIAHLPAGYLLAKAGRTKGLLFVGILVGSWLPDLDMLWFYFVDERQHVHHHYITHRPIVWVVTAIAGWLLGRRLVLGIGIGGILHCFLDSILGSIAWGWPFSDASYPLVVVPATHDFWVYSFLTHWTFGIEIAITLVAVLVLVRSKLSKDR